MLGLIGGPVVFASSTAALFGLYPQVSVWGSIAAIPVFAWEMSLAVWLIVKGFKPSAIASLTPGGSTEPEVRRPWRRWPGSWILAGRISRSWISRRRRWWP